MPAHARVPLRTAAAVLACAALATGCGVPPELRDPPGSVVPSPQSGPSTAPPAVVPSMPPTLGPTPSRTFGEAQAVACDGTPSGTQVISLLRNTSGLLPSGATATVRADTPLCAGTWQYSVVTVNGRDPLAVVTKGSPGALTLVTAGTNVCNIPVRTSAPAGIREVACESGPAPGTV
ncbi:hypothetical protein [Phytohabitans rumicis]|uniref:hypothetical protein n=1 Tax=Phytohabitans rumicis TaxID=1076125 RepID=UPI0031EC82C9